LTKICLIDSNIWFFAYTAPKSNEYAEIHKKSSQFLESILLNNTIIIGISFYQIAEIMELLRKRNLSKELRNKIFQSFKREKFHIIPLNMNHLELSFNKSLASNIHIYDYLVALPLKDMVTEIYSADDHFQHPDFKEIAPVTNPLHPWILREGRIPVRPVRNSVTR